MHLSQLIALVGAATIVSAHPPSDLFPRQGGSCAAFSKACKRQIPAVSSYCNTAVYSPTTTVTVTSTISATTTSYTTVIHSTPRGTKTRTVISRGAITTTITVTSPGSTTTLLAPGTCGGGSSSVPARMAKRSASCLTSYTASSQISSACSCAGVTGPGTAYVTSTVYSATATPTTTITKKGKQTMTTTTLTAVTSTSTKYTIVTTRGFALSYDGFYAEQPNGVDAVIFNNTLPGTVLAFSTENTGFNNGTLVALNGVLAGSTAYTSGSNDVDYIRFAPDSGLPNQIPVYCQVNADGLCQLTCQSGDRTVAFLREDGSQYDGQYSLGNNGDPGFTEFPGPNVVQYHGYIIGSPSSQ